MATLVVVMVISAWRTSARSTPLSAAYASMSASGESAGPPPAEQAAPSSTAAPIVPKEAIAFVCPVRGEFGAGTGFYSQFYEDYILSYVFDGVLTGTYVDVGAYDPHVGSVTKHFYLRGWRGLNVEPNPERLALFVEARPDDANVGVGISDGPATLPFYRFEPRASGLSTFDLATALRHREAGYRYDELSIPVATLNDVIDKSARIKGGFDFLNVDVEGFERKVLSGLDFSAHPPRVVVLEATAPLTEEPTQHLWESLLLSAGYVFAADDGLNRYYLRKSERALLSRFVEVAYCMGRDKVAKRIKLDGFMSEPGQ